MREANVTMPTVLFRVGELYSNEEIQRYLEVGNAGGVRVKSDPQRRVRRIVITTSTLSHRVIAENPYHDRIEGDVLTYTGAGRAGDQTLAGVNQRIPQQLENDFPIYAFEIIGSRRDRAIGPKRWRFLGLLEYLRHYREHQLDAEKQLRQVWLFEFRILREVAEVTPEFDFELSRSVLGNSRQSNATKADDRELAESSDASGFSPAELEYVRMQFLDLTPEMFERRLRDVLIASGFERVAVTRYSQDGGIDVNAFAGASMWPVSGLLIQLQAKRWLHTVGRKDVAELRGSLQPFARGSVVTTSHFSRAAIQEANEPGKNPIVLIDGAALAGITLSLGMKF